MHALRLVAVLAFAASGLAAGGALSAAESVGTLKNVAAWVNKMPGAPASLHVTGNVTAPTPCHEAQTEHIGDSKSNPPIYLLKVTLKDPGGICIQKISDISFHHVEENYAGNHDKVAVSFDSGSGETIDLEVVQ